MYSFFIGEAMCLPYCHFTTKSFLFVWVWNKEVLTEASPECNKKGATTSCNDPFCKPSEPAVSYRALNQSGSSTVQMRSLDPENFATTGAPVRLTIMFHFSEEYMSTRLQRLGT
jgi:hypothetical protein